MTTSPPNRPTAEQGQTTAASETAPEISTRVVSVFFLYFEHLHGRERTLQAVKHVGDLPLDYVLHPGNFVSLDYCIRVAHVLTEESGDPEFLRKAGLYQLSGPHMLGFLYYAARSLGSPRLYYRTAVRMAPSFNRVCEMTIEDLTETRLRLRYRSLKPEGTRLMCEGRMGQLAAAPTLWGLPPAVAHEVQCQVQGAPACIYELTWIPSFRPLLSSLTGLILGAGLGAVSALVLGAAGMEVFRGALWCAAMGVLTALALGYRTQSRWSTQHILDAAEASARSVDELRQRFEEVRRLNAETERAHQSLLGEMQRRERAEQALVEAQKLEAIGRLSGGIAHDFNNILTIILNYADLAKAHVRDEKQVGSSLDAIAEAALRAAQLTHQLLAFARRHVVQARVLSLEDHLQGMREMLARLVGEDVRVELALASESSRVRIDPAQLEQVILNLAANARDAMASGGTLRFQTSRVVLDGGSGFAKAEDEPPTSANLAPGNYLLLAVSDTGCGMDKDTQQRIFEPFFTTKDLSRGTGLGLSSAHGIVTQAGGGIEVDSTRGAGTTFRIYLPRVDAAPDESPRPILTPVRGGSETVLLVEDDAQIRELAARALSEAGYRVLQAADAEQALALAGSEPATIHLLITDVVMPGIDGHVLAERLGVSRPQMRVLFVSGYPHDVIARHGVRASEIQLLAKPFAVTTLARWVRDILDAPGPASH